MVNVTIYCIHGSYGILYCSLFRCYKFTGQHFFTMLDTSVPPQVAFCSRWIAQMPLLAYHVSGFLLLQYNVCEHNIILNLLLASWWNEPWDGEEPHFCRSPPCFQDFSCSFWCPFYHPKLRVVRSASGREHDSARGQGEGERRVTPLRFTWNRNRGSYHWTIHNTSSMV